MLFNSIEFLIFLSVAFFSYHAIPLRARKYHLLLFSYLFYFSWSIKYAVLLFVITCAVYGAALIISGAATEDRKRRVVWGSVAVLAGILILFKYTPWPALIFGGSEITGIHPMVIPLGISYYTFKFVSYVIDVYWQKIGAEKDFPSFAAYAAFFPQILSGPIERAAHFLPQLKNPLPVEYPMLVSGLRLILFGFFKKLVIADRLAIFVNTVYDSPSSFNSLVLLMAAYGFMFQLYADFSGLTDIARGSARLFGIETPWNFNLPFFASNLQQFWRRWHMTLTQWLSDYFFKPVHMQLRNWRNWGLAAALIVNMVLIGLWHGATLNYFVFGLIHGLLLVASVLTLKRRDLFFKNHPWLSALRVYSGPLITFHLVVFASLFFRAETLAEASSVIRHILDFDGSRLSADFFPTKDALLVVFGIVLMETVHFLQHQKPFKINFYRKPLFLRWGVYYGAFVFVMMFGQFAPQDFIYFKF